MQPSMREIIYGIYSVMKLTARTAKISAASSSDITLASVVVSTANGSAFVYRAEVIVFAVSTTVAGSSGRHVGCACEP